MGSLLNKKNITLDEVKRHMDTGQPFNIIYVTADRRRGHGGELEALKNWVKHNVNNNPSGQPGISAKGKQLKSRVAKGLYTCDPNNFQHKTRNILNLKSRKIQKLHLKLIVEFNGKNVLL